MPSYLCGGLCCCFGNWPSDYLTGTPLDGWYTNICLNPTFSLDWDNFALNGNIFYYKDLPCE